MPAFKIQEQILASPEEVFAFLTTLENAQKINPQVRKCEQVENTEMQAGVHFRQSRSYQGGERVTEFELKEIEGGRCWHVQTEKEGICADYRYEVKALGSGTELTLHAQVEAEGLRSVLAWFVAEYMKRRDRNLLEKIEVAIIKNNS